MGLTRAIRRLRYVYGWRLRHWWLDTHQGRVAQLTAAGCAFLLLIGATVRVAIVAMLPAKPAQPHEAFLWLVVWLIVALVAAVALAMTAAKPAKPADQQITTPTTQDGRSAVRYYGTVWIDDPAMLAWKVVGRDPIQTKGGKK